MRTQHPKEPILLSPQTALHLTTNIAPAGLDSMRVVEEGVDFVEERGAFKVVVVERLWRREVEDWVHYGHPQEPSVTIVARRDAGSRTVISGGLRIAEISKGEEHAKLPFSPKDQLQLESRVWIIDSGASQHLGGCREFFSTYSDISKDQAITIAEGTQIKAKGIGAIEHFTGATSIKLTECVLGVAGTITNIPD